MSSLGFIGASVSGGFNNVGVEICVKKSQPRAVKAGSSRRSLNKSGVVFAVADTKDGIMSTDLKKKTELNYKRNPQDWRKTWVWNGHSIRYAVMNENNQQGPAIVLVHGFGASADHFRYNLPVLASMGYRTYAIDMLGFGLSDKPTIPNTFSTYGAFVWMEQIASFIKEIVQSDAYLLGNSLGGYSVLNVAAFYPKLTRGLILVNSAGPIVAPEQVDFDVSWNPADADPHTKDPFQAEDFLGVVQDAFKRIISFAGFLLIRRKTRIEKVLRQVYPDDQSNVNEDIVNFILEAAYTDNAFEVFYRTAIGGRAMRTGYTVNNLCDRIKKMNIPTTLIWGVNDPWITSERADKMVQILGSKDCFVPITAGHCAHDENPQDFNHALLMWLESQERSRSD